MGIYFNLLKVGTLGERFDSSRSSGNSGSSGSNFVLKAELENARRLSYSYDISCPSSIAAKYILRPKPTRLV